MPKVFEKNVRCVLADEAVILALIAELHAKLPDGEGDDEITLSDSKRHGKIVIAQGAFPIGTEKRFRELVQRFDKRVPKRYGVSMARDHNYGKYRTAHLPAEYLAFQK
jgi:hypothetical protein